MLERSKGEAGRGRKGVVTGRDMGKWDMNVADILPRMTSGDGLCTFTYCTEYM